MQYLSSMYIDNEMDLDEKKQFVEKVRCDSEFYTQTLDLLTQEQRLQPQVVFKAVASEKKWQPSMWVRLIPKLKPLGFTAAGVFTGVLIAFLAFQPGQIPLQNNRFVLFKPEARQVELTGSFTGWQRLPMQRVGKSGYWELILPVASGEHRFAYILDKNHRMADPTLPARERDDFGGENSILTVGQRI